MKNISISFSKTLPYLKEDEIISLYSMIETAHNMLHSGSCVGGVFLGWVNQPVNYDKEEFERIIEVAKRIRENSDVLIVIGIGGSYLGARAAIEMLEIV